MRYGSICSGIEAATQAWHSLGLEAVFFSEIDKFPRAVLEHHYPDTPLHGDFTTIGKNEYGPIDLLVGGTPCQSFSVAGLRKGMDDDRGNLALEYLRLAERTGATWLVWENVPGVLSSNEGRDFGAFLGGLVELEYGFAYRVLDAQFFGVPQRRRRVFVIGYLGDWRPAASVLFERHSLQGHPAPRREKRQGPAPDVAKSIRGNSGGIDREDMHTIIPSVARMRCFGDYEFDEKASALLSRDHKDHKDHKDLVIHIDGGETFRTLKARYDGMPTADGKGYDVIAFSSKDDGQGSAIELSPTLRAMTGERANGGGQIAFQPRYARNGRGAPDTIAAPLTAEAGRTGKGDSAQCVAFDTTQITHPENRSNPQAGDPCHTLAAGAHPPAIARSMAVRRLTPIECERLQGFPDNFTQIPWRGKDPEFCPDGPRYKALGNSMAVPVMRWIGDRIQLVEEIINE